VASIGGGEHGAPSPDAAATPAAPFDIILLDIVMRFSDGSQVAQDLRTKHGWRRPLIAVTANGANEAALLSHGFDAVVRKPFTAESLAAALRLPVVQGRLGGSFRGAGLMPGSGGCDSGAGGGIGSGGGGSGGGSGTTVGTSATLISPRGSGGTTGTAGTATVGAAVTSTAAATRGRGGSGGGGEGGGGGGGAFFDRDDADSPTRHVQEDGQHPFGVTVSAAASRVGASGGTGSADADP